MRYSFKIVLFLTFADSFVSMQRIISVPRVLSAMFSLPLFSLWAICYCWLIAVVVPDFSIGWLNTLYTIMIVIFLFSLPLIVSHDNLSISRGSSPCVVTLGCNVGCRIVKVPPGLYTDDHGMVDL